MINALQIKLNAQKVRSTIAETNRVRAHAQSATSAASPQPVVLKPDLGVNAKSLFVPAVVSMDGKPVHPTSLEAMVGEFISPTSSSSSTKKAMIIAADPVKRQQALDRLAPLKQSVKTYRSQVLSYTRICFAAGIPAWPVTGHSITT